MASSRELRHEKMLNRAAALFLGLVLAALMILPFQSSASAATPPQSTPAAKTTHHSSTTKKKSTHRHSSRREPFQKAPTPARISEIQTALSRGGYFEGDPNGKWDSSTVSAMQKFQSANGLNSSGKIDATTLQKLGLGSGTAGVDAPKPLKKSDPSTSSATARSSVTTNTNSASTAAPVPAAPSPAAKPPQR